MLTRAILTRLILIAIAGAGLYELRRWTMREFPDVQTGDMVGRMREQVSGWWNRRGRPAPGPQTPSHPEDRRIERLERLASLRERGLLSQEEFEAEKAALVGKSGDA